MEKRLQQWRKLEEEAKGEEVQMSFGSTTTFAGSTTTIPVSAGFQTGTKFSFSRARASSISVGSNPIASELKTPSEVITPCPYAGYLKNPQLAFSIPKSATASRCVSSHSSHPFSTALSENPPHSLSSGSINLVEAGRTGDQVWQSIRPCTTPLAINLIPAPRHLTGQIFVFPDSPLPQCTPHRVPESQPTEFNESSKSNNSFVSSPPVLVPHGQRSAGSSVSDLILEDLEESEVVSLELTSSCQLHGDADCLLQASSLTELSCLEEETDYPSFHTGTIASPRELPAGDDLYCSGTKAGYEMTVECESDAKVVYTSVCNEASSFLPFQVDPTDSNPEPEASGNRSTVEGREMMPIATIDAATIEEDCGEKSCTQKLVAPVRCTPKGKVIGNSVPEQDGPHPNDGQYSDHSSTAKPCLFGIRLPSKPIPMSLESLALHECSVPIAQAFPQAISTPVRVMYVGRDSASLAAGNVRGCQEFGNLPPQMQYTQTDI